MLPENNMNEEIESKLNIIFEQDGKVYAICANEVPYKDLAKFIRQELKDRPPRAQMRVVTTAEFRKMPFGRPSDK